VRLQEAEDTLRAIRAGEIDPLLVEGAAGPRLDVLQGLEAEENRVRGAMLAQVSDAVIAVDVDERVTYINAAAERQYGVTADNALGRPLSEMHEYRWLRPDDEAAALTALREQGEWRGENIHITRDGRRLHVESSVTLLRGSDGTATGMVAAIRDITKRKRAEERLRESEHFLQRITEVTPGVLHVFDLEKQRAVFVSRSVASMIGYSAEEITAMGNEVIPTLMHPDDVPRFAAHIQRVRTLGDHEFADFEHRMRARSGEWRWFQNRDAVFARDAAGAVRQMIGAAMDVTERKRIEEALRTNEERMTRAERAARSGTWDWYFQSGEASWSDSAWAVFGRTPGEFKVTFDTWLACVHPEDRTGAMAAIEAARGTGLYRDEYRVFDPDGTGRWVESRGEFMFDENNQPVRMLGTVLDITVRKHAEDALAERTRELGAVLASVQDHVYIFDPAGRFAFANQKLLDFWGLDAGQAIGKTMRDLDYPAEVETTLLDGVRRVCETGEAVASETHYTSPTGVEGWFENILSPMRRDDGRVAFVAGSSRDITARKRAEVAIRESEAVLRTVTREAHVGLAMVNQDRRYVFANETYSTILGLPDAGLMGQRVSHVLSHVYDEIRPKLDRALAGYRVQYELRLPVHPRTGDEHVYDVVYEPRSGGAGPYVVVVIVDITGRKNAQQILERTVAERTGELQRALDELETQIAERQRLECEILEISEREQWRIGRDLHDDIGQQLVAIGIFAFKLETRLREEAHACAADVVRLRAELGTALQTTRDLSKSLFPVELERGGLVLAIEELAIRTQSLTQANCRVSADADFWIERESAIHLYRLVQESITNAIKHGKPKNISIECRVRDGLRTVRICDDGVGFRMPDLASKSAGVGLQLFQYRARLLGARVEVRTMSDGTGCEVICRFSSPPQTSGD
jgi:PAS domain S-box-containing protein